MIEKTNARKSTWMRKSLWILIPLALFVLWWAVPTVNQARLDAQVRELCAKDGGIKVYETVTLPAEKFNQWGQVNFYRPTQGENALGSEFIFKEEHIYYQRGSPEMWRIRYQLFRRSDGKLLGESIGYSRRGGDPIGPWNDSSFGCPDNRGDVPFLSQIFIKIK